MWYFAVKKERRCNVAIQAKVTKKFLTRGCMLQYWHDGVCYEKKVAVGNNPTSYQEDMPVDIKINPQNPQEIIIKDILGGKAMKIAAGIIGGIGILFFIFAVLLTFLS